MRVARRAVLMGAALILFVAACSASATPATIYVTPTPSEASPGQATENPTAAPSQTANETANATVAPAPATSAPTPTPAAPVTPTPTSAASFQLGTLLPLKSLLVPFYVHGAYLLYETSILDSPESFLPQAWVIKPDGTGARKIAEGISSGAYSPPNYNLEARWSHDGSTIHVIKACTPAISDVSVIGWGTTPRTTMTTKDEGFVWSPDDRTIYYWHYSGVDVVCEQNSVDDTRDFRKMNFDGTARTTIRVGANYQPSQAFPNGTAVLAYDDNLHQLKVNVATGVPTSLGITGWPARVSPDGNKIAWVQSGHVYVRLVSGGTSKNLGVGTDFAWRPDSAALAVSGATLRVVNATTAASVTIYNFSTKSPTWSPDKMKIAFIKSSGGGALVIPAAGGSVTVLPGTSRATSISWQP
jgi:hypothetical protein